MARQMSQAAYREDQWAHRYDAHVAPFNRLVDELGRHDEAGSPPYIAPMYRGVRARALAILRDPGPKAAGVHGSGFLSTENNDPTAERQYDFIVSAGIDPADVLPWNAYPWYINAAPNAAQTRAGTGPLHRVLQLLPSLKVVLLFGGDARRAWKYFTNGYPRYAEDRGIEVFPTYHPGRQALWHKDPEVRATREASIRETFAQAADILRDE